MCFTYLYVSGVFVGRCTSERPVCGKVQDIVLPKFTAYAFWS
jgi:hypothetical protein